MNNAQLIGRGRYTEPVPVSGVAEVASLERSLEQMRQALASTTISRDYLDDVLNGMSDAVLVTSPDGRIRTANDAASRLFGVDDLPGTMFADLVAAEHRADVRPRETRGRTRRDRDPDRSAARRSRCPSTFRRSGTARPRSAAAASSCCATSPTASAPSGASATSPGSTR